ncbi:MAG: HAD hydrolase family protein [Gemmatimonadetes bacterium]|uniref:3-deoxy-D-manno-octulosonate 8-phosphate phosphatase KdsC n=1 Tax=Candidatus Kutchimonas denitrificans TaxID=3056748 RepID=A0AAE5CC57_9BACT|nr:HAD hydrolase family protein [Gemmatimonadota bacterium]NIR75240.1 HAD hydrolase family protein [Candidatus Kutchimonas denitrificans]NIS00178.1 HAD hydrolase family protein [Gemmatimonadota bacterium]NIT65770.1 HAD hydrolase family protein [Gemmatimonadota bacterium]NIU53048.1 HAD hydrolase family protein [Gemmatimonadota bacterium]
MAERDAIPTETAAAVKLVVLDVDGVMTDGGIYYAAGPEGGTLELKRFEITDGLGIKLLQRAGIEVAFVTGRHSEIVEMRGRELGVREIHQDPAAKKLPIVRAILDRKALDWKAVAFVSDDLADMPVLKRCGLPVAVANAVPEVSAAAIWQTTRPGGSGAVREFAEALLRARGDWDTVVGSYLAEREVGADG